MKSNSLPPLFAVLLLALSCGDDPVRPALQQVPITDLLASAIAVIHDPSGRAPLTAEATIDARDPVTVSITVLGEAPLTQEFTGSATTHTIPILGLYPGRENQVEVRVAGRNRFAVDTLTIPTNPLPDIMPDIEVVAAEPALMEPGWNLSNLHIGLGSTFRSMPIIHDRSGTIRWYLDQSEFNETTWLVQRLRNGNLLFGYDDTLYEYDMLGREQQTWSIPGYGMHHDLIEMPNGNLLVSVVKGGIGTIDDHVVEVDRTSGQIVTEWDLRESLDMRRRDFVDDAGDWFHMNSVWYSEADDAIIVSGRNQGVVKLTRDNRVVWILAPHRGWGRAGLNGNGADLSESLLTAVDADGNPYPDEVQDGAEDATDFRWPWGQHAAMLLPNGHLFLFDNGFTRNFGAASTNSSRGVEYEIDEEAGTVRQVWEYGADRGDAFFSAIISDVDHLPGTGNRLIMPGIVVAPEHKALITEVTYPAGDVVFEAVIRFRNRLSGGTLSWGNFDMVYQSERISIY